MAKKAIKAAGPKRSHHKKKPAMATAPLPPPMELPSEPQPQPKPNGGLLNLGNLFQPQQLEPEPMFSMPSPAASAGSSPSDPLSPEAEQILSQIPETIGGEADDAGGPGDVGGQLGAAGLMGDICDEAAARWALEWIGDLLVDWRKREEYREAGKRASGAAKHWATVVNGLWAKYAPAFLLSLGNANPGLIPAVCMTAVAFGPAVMADMKASAKERRPGLVQPAGGPVPAPVQPAKPRMGLVAE